MRRPFSFDAASVATVFGVLLGFVLTTLYSSYQEDSKSRNEMRTLVIDAVVAVDAISIWPLESDNDVPGARLGHINYYRTANAKLLRFSVLAKEYYGTIPEEAIEILENARLFVQTNSRLITVGVARTAVSSRTGLPITRFRALGEQFEPLRAKIIDSLSPSARSFGEYIISVAIFKLDIRAISVICILFISSVYLFTLLARTFIRYEIERLEAEKLRLNEKRFRSRLMPTSTE